MTTMTTTTPLASPFLHLLLHLRIQHRKRLMMAILMMVTVVVATIKKLGSAREGKGKGLGGGRLAQRVWKALLSSFVSTPRLSLEGERHGNNHHAPALPPPTTTSSGTSPPSSSSSPPRPLHRQIVLGDGGRARCSSSLRQQFLTQKYCDVTFNVGGHLFHAHRCWVAAFSQPLCAMFQSGMRESRETIVHLHDTDPEAFRALLNFIYNGPVELNEDNLEGLLELSARLHVVALMDRCCDFLAGGVHTDNACSILTIADKYNCRPLRRDALLFVVAHFPQCWRADKGGWCDLGPSLVREVLSQDGLHHPETEAFQAALAWLTSSPAYTNDRCVVEEVMGHIRFCRLPPSYLMETVENHPLMQTTVTKGFVHEAYRFQAMQDHTSSQAFSKHLEAMGERARPRSPPPPPSSTTTSTTTPTTTRLLSPSRLATNKEREEEEATTTPPGASDTTGWRIKTKEKREVVAELQYSEALFHLAASESKRRAFV